MSSIEHRSAMQDHNAEPVSIVALTNVIARIEQRDILNDVTVVLRHGEHVGIIGANGSGKSTLLGLIGGSLWPAPGTGTRRYFFDGREHRDAVLARQRITLVGPELQDTYVRMGWNFSALAVVVTGLRRTEIPRSRHSAADVSRAHSLLELLHAGHLAQRPFLELSRGEQRRVLLARALAFDPQVLLLDEPGSGLDTQSRAELEAAIENVSARTTIVATAHAGDLLPRIVRRILEVRDGRVVALETPGARPAASTHRELHVARDAGDSTDTVPKRLPERAGGAARTHTPAPLIELRNADVWVGARRVLSNVDWQLERGDSWLVRGSNGAGKSTFLRLLHGQIRPARGGTISWPGLGNPRNVWRVRRHIAWVSPELQAAYRYPTTVAQCVSSGFRSSIGLTTTLSPQEAMRRDELIDSFGLAALADRPLKKLSYGQARRALLARTLATEPAVLLLDEPWEGLDPETIALVVRQLKAAMQRGAQIVCASHVGDAGLGLQRRARISHGAIHVDADA